MRARLIAVNHTLPEYALWRVLSDTSPPSLSIVSHSKPEPACSSLVTTPRYTDSLATIRLRAAKVGNVRDRTASLSPYFLDNRGKPETPCGSFATTPCYTHSLTTIRLQVAKVGNVHYLTVRLWPYFLGSRGIKGKLYIIDPIIFIVLGYLLLPAPSSSTSRSSSRKSELALILSFRLILLFFSFTIENPFKDLLILQSRLLNTHIVLLELAISLCGRGIR